MKKRQLNKLNLDRLPTYFTDSTDTSPDVFRITEFPTTLTSGKNLIKLQGNPDALQSGTYIEIEVLDYNRDPIYNEILEYVSEDGSRVIAIYVYDDTSNGDAIVTLTTQITNLNGNAVPPGWKNKVNAKWSKVIPVNPKIPNKSEVIFVTEPIVTIEEQIGVQLDRNYSASAQFPTYNTGTVKFINRNNQPAMILSGGEFTSDMKGGTITVATPVNPTPTPNYPLTDITLINYSSEIKKVLNNSLIYLESPFTFYSSQSISKQEYKAFDNSSYSILYEASPTYTTTQHSESFALMQIKGLEPATGDITRIKLYVNSNGTIGTYELINDIDLTTTEIFVDATGSIYPDASIGFFTSQSIIDTYWTGSTYIGTTSDTTPSLVWSTSSLNNAMVISSSTDISAFNSVFIAQTTSSLPGIFIKDSQYKVQFDAISTALTASNNPKLAVYLSGSAFNFDPTDVLNQELPVKLGKRIGEIETVGIGKRYDDINFVFDADDTGEASLLFVVESGEWKLSEVQTLTLAETGYTENYTRVRTEIPTKHKSGNQLSFKVEYYNVNGDKSNTITYVNDKSFEGGNRYIDGSFSMLTGSLYVADSLESGIDITGLANTGYIRSLGYEGFNQATGSGGTGGFLLFSGSALPHQTATSYQGVGLEMVANSGSYFRYRTDPSILDIHTETFFLGNTNDQYISGSNGNLEISSSNFSIDIGGNVTASDAHFRGVSSADFYQYRNINVGKGPPSSPNNLSTFTDGGLDYYSLDLTGSYDPQLPSQGPAHFCRIVSESMDHPIGAIVIHENSGSYGNDNYQRWGGYVILEAGFDFYIAAKKYNQNPITSPYKLPPDSEIGWDPEDWSYGALKDGVVLTGGTYNGVWHIKQGNRVYLSQGQNDWRILTVSMYDGLIPQFYSGIFVGPTGSSGGYQLPPTDGSAGQVLKTDGSGTLYWDAP